MYTDKACLTEDAEKYCNLITDSAFWSGLEHVEGDIKPISYGKNINQKDSTRADLLLTLTRMFLHFKDQPIKEVKIGMSKHLEKRWKDCDQPLFLLTLILNPFEGLSAFGQKAGMDHFNYKMLLVQVC
jgi:hypothetical protein